ANDLDRIEQSLRVFPKTKGRPTLIILDSHIGYGAPDTNASTAALGAALGDEEVRLAKRFYGWPEEAQFLVPDGVRERFAAGVGARGHQLSKEWYARWNAFRSRYPDLAGQLERLDRGELPDDWDKDLPEFLPDPKGLASRDASGKVLNAIAPRYPWLIGGADDLAPSTKTLIKD